MTDIERWASLAMKLEQWLAVNAAGLCLDDEADRMTLAALLAAAGCPDLSTTEGTPDVTVT